MNRDQHIKWLLKNNVHPEQIRSRRKNSPRKLKGFSVARSYYENLGNTFSPSAGKKSIWETIRTGNETEATIRAIKEKATRVGPAFNKGALQYIPLEMIPHAGKK